MSWTIDDARNTYAVRYWGGGYFDVNADGHLQVSAAPGTTAVDMMQIADTVRREGLTYPVLLRFPGILQDRVRQLCDAFDAVRDELEYQAPYTAIYPIKVNQQRTVVENILSGGGERIGLEAGSKPELMAVLGLSRPGATVVCNGYKDREYIRLALIGLRLGLKVYIVIEKLSELEVVIQESRDLGVKPLLGLRVRLASLGSGNWQNTGGEKAKFGLSASQVLRMVERLASAEMLDSLKLLHFHMGSQIANIHDIQKGLREAVRHYVELHRLGADVDVVDVGGGLGVDYDGTRSRSACSMNYGLQEYARNVVTALKEACQLHALPQPRILSESGRAMTAHHAMLLVNVTEVESRLENCLPVLDEDAPVILHDLQRALTTLQERSPVEAWHEVEHRMQEVQEMYTHGVLTLEQRANAESIYSAVCDEVRRRLDGNRRHHRDVLDELQEKLSDKYFCNFSLFQSLPDVWAIRQIFPIMPLHRLDETPTRRGVIQDLTCDSDGRIDQYVDAEGVESSLPLHALREEETYLLGFFMLGAYQEILGDMHNLFGDTHAVNVELDGRGGFELSEAEHGDGIDELLSYVHFRPQALSRSYQAMVHAAGLQGEEARRLMATLEAGLRGYTYLED